MVQPQASNTVGGAQRTSLINRTTLLRWRSCIMPAGGESRQRGLGISAVWATRISITLCLALFCAAPINSTRSGYPTDRRNR